VEGTIEGDVGEHEDKGIWFRGEEGEWAGEGMTCLT